MFWSLATVKLSAPPTAEPYGFEAKKFGAPDRFPVIEAPPVSRAHHRVFDEPRLICETDARAKVVAVSVNQRSAETRSVRESRVRGDYAGDFDVGVFVIRLARPLKIIVPQAEIDRQIRSRLPIVIGIER